MKRIAAWLDRKHATTLDMAWVFFGGLWAGAHWPFWWIAPGFLTYLVASLVCVLLVEDRRA